MLSEETLEELKCALSDEEHFVIEPITLSNCGHSVCKKCIRNNDSNEIKCRICGLVSKQNFFGSQASKGTQKLLKIYLEDIFAILKAEASLKLNELKVISIIYFNCVRIMFYSTNFKSLNFG